MEMESAVAAPLPKKIPSSVYKHLSRSLERWGRVVGACVGKACCSFAIVFQGDPKIRSCCSRFFLFQVCLCHQNAKEGKFRFLPVENDCSNEFAKGRDVCGLVGVVDWLAADLRRHLERIG